MFPEFGFDRPVELCDLVVQVQNGAGESGNKVSTDFLGLTVVRCACAAAMALAQLSLRSSSLGCGARR